MEHYSVINETWTALHHVIGGYVHNLVNKNSFGLEYKAKASIVFNNQQSTKAKTFDGTSAALRQKQCSIIAGIYTERDGRENQVTLLLLPSNNVTIYQSCNRQG